jgi:uncharacterized membrane protein (UPF0127 family)
VVVAVLAARGGSDEGASGPTTTASPVVAPDIDAGTTAPLDGGALGEGTVPERDGRSPLQGFGEVAVTITSTDGEVCELCLLSAVSAEQRARGLMEVTDEDLGGYDGMLFEFPEPSAGAFWMRNTPMPLSIAYLDAGGELVSTADMAPCPDTSDCPRYGAAGPFRYALEVPQGRLDDLGIVPGATVEVG